MLVDIYFQLPLKNYIELHQKRSLCILSFQTTEAKYYLFLFPVAYYGEVFTMPGCITRTGVNPCRSSTACSTTDSVSYVSLPSPPWIHVLLSISRDPCWNRFLQYFRFVLLRVQSLWYRHKRSWAWPETFAKPFCCCSCLPLYSFLVFFCEDVLYFAGFFKFYFYYWQECRVYFRST